jgi:flagellin-specific chaperone FliS
MNTTSIVTAIVAAIAALALMVPGLDALKASLTGVQNAQKSAASQQCSVEVVRDKIPFNQMGTAQAACESKANTNIETNFKKAFEMIDKFKNTLSAEANATQP